MLAKAAVKAARLCANDGAVISATGTFDAHTALDDKDLGSNGPTQ